MISVKYIKATKDYATFQKPVAAPYLRKSFVLDALPDAASLSLTCTGFYRVWINGKEITAGRLAPYIVNPDETVFYDVYDLGEHLTVGKNTLAFLLGNGMSNAMGGTIWDFDKAAFRSAPKLAFSFEMKNAEETVCAFEADESVLCAPSPIVFDDLRCGEFYDATKEMGGWNLPDFDDSAWTSAIPTDPARGRVYYNETDKVVITKELKAEKVYPGHIVPIDRSLMDERVWTVTDGIFYTPEEHEEGFVFEFGENTSCVPRLRIKGHKGQKIILQASEYCDKDGGICYQNIQGFYPIGFAQRDIYICKGEGVEEYIPSFTYHGARYFIVIGADKEQIADDTVTMLVQNSELAERGSFSCSDPIANALWKNARISDLANFVYFPTDCPHREKNGWTGDAAMSAEHMFQNLAVENSFKQWLRMIREAQREDGAFPGVVPTSGFGYAWGDGHGPAWDAAIIELPYQAYIYRGDLTLFFEAKNMIVKYLHFIAEHRRADGTVKIGLGDWCHALRDGSHNHVCPTEVSDTATCVNICRKAKFLFDVCGMKPQSIFAEVLFNELRAAFREHFIDFGTMTVYGRCQAAQSVALYYELFDRGEVAAAYDVLLDLIHEADDHFDCGMLGVRTMFRILAKHGDGELAYKMITRTDAPSYGIMVKDFDLRSVPESFHRTVDGSTTSLNHHFMSDYAGFFAAHIAGLVINPYKNDASFVRVAPTFVSSLTFAETDYETIAGKISVRWERSGEKILLNVQKADGVSGEVILPDGYVFDGDAFMSGRRISGLVSACYTVKKL